jgi:hypothetical protein
MAASWGRFVGQDFSPAIIVWLDAWIAVVPAVPPALEDADDAVADESEHRPVRADASRDRDAFRTRGWSSVWHCRSALSSRRASVIHPGGTCTMTAAGRPTASTVRTGY